MATSLGEITRWYSGGTPRKNEPAFWGGNIPWLSASSMKEIRLSNSDIKVTELGLKNGTRLAPTGAVLLLVRGSELHKRIPVGITTRPVAFNQDVKALVAKDSVLPEFVLYWFLANEPMLLSKVEFTGIGAGKLDTALMMGLPFALPPLGEQRAIAHILGTLDDKIELNRRMNETLEGIARALFKSWFVDFDPVRAKAEGREPVGMDAETAALFPDSFQESELGLIPAGWKVATIGDLAEETIGGDWGKDEYFQGSEQAIVLRGTDLQDIRESGFASAAPVRWVRRKTIENRALTLEDVVIGGSGAGPIGRSLWCAQGLLQMFELPVVYSNFCKRIRAHSRAHAVWLDDYLNDMRLSGEHLAYATGTSVPNLDLKGLLTTRPLLVPSDTVLGLYVKIRELSWKRRLLPESRVLAEIRDSLLPKLISGELRVPDAEKLLAGSPL